MKNRVTAALLAILLGGFGVHKFYLGKTGTGILFILFFWTGIPAIIGLVEGIIMLTQSDEEFKEKQGLESVVPTSGALGVSNVSKADELKKYKELYDAGAITQEEYEKKKAELL
ncbi:MAG: NINE protein [Candidatus Izemoplasmatales bacterium]